MAPGALNFAARRHLIGGVALDYTSAMARTIMQITTHASATTPSRRTLHAEMLRLCARIGYSPPSLR